MRKALMAEQKKADMVTWISTLENECSQLQTWVEELDKEIESIVIHNEEEWGRDKETHEANIKTLKELINEYKEELEYILTKPQ